MAKASESRNDLSSASFWGHEQRIFQTVHAGAAEAVARTVAEDRHTDQRHVLFMGGISISLASSMLRALALRISPVSRLRWPSSSSEIIPKKKQADDAQKAHRHPFTQTRHILSCNYCCANIRKAACRDKLKRPFFRIWRDWGVFRPANREILCPKAPSGGDFHATDLPGRHSSRISPAKSCAASISPSRTRQMVLTREGS